MFLFPHCIPVICLQLAAEHLLLYLFHCHQLTFSACQQSSWKHGQQIQLKSPKMLAIHAGWLLVYLLCSQVGNPLGKINTTSRNDLMPHGVCVLYDRLAFIFILQWSNRRFAHAAVRDARLLGREQETGLGRVRTGVRRRRPLRPVGHERDGGRCEALLRPKTGRREAGQSGVHLRGARLPCRPPDEPILPQVCTLTGYVLNFKWKLDTVDIRINKMSAFWIYFILTFLAFNALFLSWKPFMWVVKLLLIVDVSYGIKLISLLMNTFYVNFEIFQDWCLFHKGTFHI